MTTVKADNDSSGRQQHARLGGGLQRGRTRAGGERRWRHGVAMMAAEAEDGSGGRRRWQMMTTVKADNNNSDGGRGQRRRRTMTAANANGTQDRAADYEGEGGEWAANNNGIRARREKSVKNKEIKIMQKDFFSNTVCPVGFFAPAKTPNLWF
jgi:hypothetical protein